MCSSPVTDGGCCEDFNPGVIHAAWTYSNCNSHGVSNNLLQKVQSAQNAAARLITGTRRCEHITLVLQKLHWLPVCRQVEIKLACLVHSVISCTNTGVSRFWHLAYCRHWPPSALVGVRMCINISEIIHALFSEVCETEAFQTAKLCCWSVWNALPSYLRQATSYTDISRCQKTCLGK